MAARDGEPHPERPRDAMITPEQVKRFIEQGMACEHVEVQGDGQHFEAIVVSAEFFGRNRVQQHQRVYQALGNRMQAEIHALSMQTFTPEQWRERGGAA
jgi:acid stress-induced BolA-like protein IbaG/YrbA